MNIFKYVFLFYISIFFDGCNSNIDEKNLVEPLKHINSSIENRNLSDQFKKYWFDGQAEITSYKLLQERYGEIREGSAVAIFVTEDFLPQDQVKTVSKSDKNILVLKLNLTKKFKTGIYPYSIMSSIFNPVSTTNHALKISNSVQEWCGQVYMQLNNREKLEIQSHSYFEGEADQKLSLDKTWLEDELWNLIRINPEELPIGDFSVIPSFEYIRLRHKEINEYQAFADIKQRDSLTVYTLKYNDLGRQLKIFFKNSFPYEIEKWEEVNYTDQTDTLGLKTTATKLERMKIDYWNKNRNEFASLRDSLGLK